MKPYYFAFFVMLGAYFLPACDGLNVDYDDPETQEVEQMMIKGEWLYTGEKHDDVDVWSAIDPCFKDDIEVYKRNGQAETRHGRNRCALDDPAVSTWDWGLLELGMKMWWGENGQYDTGIIDRLDDSLLHISYFSNDPDQEGTEFFVEYTNVK